MAHFSGEIGKLYGGAPVFRTFKAQGGRGNWKIAWDTSRALPRAKRGSRSECEGLAKIMHLG
jgi:hypothetical protein